LYTLLWDDEQGSYPIGYVLDKVYQEMLKLPDGIKGWLQLETDEERRTLRIMRNVPNEAQRTLYMASLADYWRGRNTFPLLRGWRYEAWPVYGRGGELLFSMERTAVGLLGAMRYGVHMVAYVRDEAAPHGLRLWIPRRAANKSTFPGMLDNTVAGGMATGEVPAECVAREADEEASLPMDLVRREARFAGIATYIYITDAREVGEAGYIYPECQWVYDLELPAGVVPRPKDGEVESFNLRRVDEVTAALANGEFKPNCALVTIDFLIRHGILNADNEPDLLEIKRRMRREMPFPGPHQREQPTSQ
jgi:8-oxo-dGTP pyrophosphatase MutT (NUDIX family)